MSAKGSKLRVTKIAGPSEIGSYSETVEFTLLHCNNFQGNNNKFYIIEIQKSDLGYRLFSNYGRLGSTSIYEIRSHFKETDELVTDYDDIKSEYDAIIHKKERGKTVKGVKETYSKVNVIAPTVGSSNICSNDSIEVESVVDVDTGSFNYEVQRIIKQLTDDNIHDILSKTSLKLTSRGLETDIGIVTESHIDEAISVLDMINDAISQNDDDQILESNNRYFSLIPQKFGHKLHKSDMISNSDKLAESYELMNNLKTALKTSVNQKDSKVKIDLTYLDDSTEWARLEKFFESSKHKDHSHLNSWKIKNIFKFNESIERLNDYEKYSELIGNDHELFHGSRNTNILSILVKGFYIPPSNSGHVTGRMFSDGVYAASCSTKALNYSTGFWDGKGDDRNAFVFITRFLMGNIQKCKNFKYDGADDGYDSILGLTRKDGGSLLNEEYVVYNTTQTLITHLIELQK